MVCIFEKYKQNFHGTPDIASSVVNLHKFITNDDTVIVIFKQKLPAVKFKIKQIWIYIPNYANLSSLGWKNARTHQQPRCILVL